MVPLPIPDVKSHQFNIKICSVIHFQEVIACERQLEYMYDVRWGICLLFLPQFTFFGVMMSVLHFVVYQKSEREKFALGNHFVSCLTIQPILRIFLPQFGRKVHETKWTHFNNTSLVNYTLKITPVFIRVISLPTIIPNSFDHQVWRVVPWNNGTWIGRRRTTLGSSASDESSFSHSKVSCNEWNPLFFSHNFLKTFASLNDEKMRRKTSWLSITLEHNHFQKFPLSPSSIIPESKILIWTFCRNPPPRLKKSQYWSAEFNDFISEYVVNQSNLSPADVS